MARLCENDHEVREGMLVCPTCGSDVVGERERGQAQSPEAGPPSSRRRQAEEQLTGFINRGVLFLVLALVSAGVSIAMAAGGSGAGYGFFALFGWGLGIAGGAYLLCGVVGWGVKYGNEATARD